MVEVKVNGTSVECVGKKLSANNGVIYIYSDKNNLLDIYEVGNVKDSVNIFALRCNSVRINGNDEKLQSKNWYKKYKKYVDNSESFNIKVLESDLLGVDKNNSRIMEIYSHRRECQDISKTVNGKSNNLEGYKEWDVDLTRVAKLSGVAQVTVNGKTIAAVLGNDVIDECQKIIRGIVLAYIGDETSDFYKKLAEAFQKKEIKFYIKEIENSKDRYREFSGINAPLKKEYEGFNKWISKNQKKEEKVNEG